jgi:uncharacterized membrane protein (DUF106 family)
MTLIGLPAGIEEILVAIASIALVTLIYKFLMNQNEVKELKDKMKEKQARAKEVQNSNPEEAKRIMSEMLSLSNKQLRMSTKPMMLTLIVSLVLILPFLSWAFPGQVVSLPFSLPYLGSNFGWLAWYFIVSIPLNSIMRKALGVEL